MRLATFENEIPGAIVKRGKEYFTEGAVKDLQVMDNGQCFAVVEGTEDYEVDIILNPEGEINEYSCNCPYEGDLCKHIVAVLFQLREESLESGHSGKTKEKDSWKNLISVIPETELREFVKEQAAKSREFRNALMIKYAGYDTRDNRDKYNHIIKEIFTSAEGRHQFIDYYSVPGAMQQIFGLLARADEYASEGNYHEAFNIAAAVAPACISAIQNMDDSDGECGEAISNAFKIVSMILESDASSRLKNEVFDWLLGEAINSDYDDFGCSDSLYPLLAEAADTPDKSESVLDFLDARLKTITSKDAWYREIRAKMFLGLKMDILNKTGQEEKAGKIMADNLHIHDFRKIAVEKQVTENCFGEAIRLIKEGIDIAIKDDYRGIITDWKEMLLDIYKRLNNVKEWRGIARDLYFSGRHEIKYYLEYKSTFQKEEWPPELEKMIATLRNQKNGPYLFQAISSDLAAVYIEEKMWGELLGMLQKNANIHTVIQYSRYLVKDYAQDLIPLYNNAIAVTAERASDRKDYHEIASHIVKMAEIPGGKGPARQLANQLMEKYKQRRAMKDELEKILTRNL